MARRDGRQWWWLVALAAVVIAGAVGAGTLVVRGGEDGADPAASPAARRGQVRVAGVPLLADHVAPPGSPLHRGLVVPPGAHLLGEALPVPGEFGTLEEPPPGDGGSWTAVLVVTGSVVGAVTDLADQLEARGAEVQIRCDRHVSSPDVGEQTTCRLVAEEQAGEGGESGPWFVVAEAVRAPGREAMGSQVGLARASHLMVRWERVAGAEEAPTGLAAEEGLEPGADIVLPRGWPDLPGPGDLLLPEATSPPGHEEVLRLGPDLALVGPETAGVFTPSRFVLVARGDPVAAVERLLEPVVAAHEPTGSAYLQPVERWTEAGRTVHRVVLAYDLSGYVAFVVARPGHPTYVLLQHHFLD